MTWQAHLSLDYRLAQGRTLLDFSHDGPLRALQSLYPEGASICHNVIVHPPSGIAGGDHLRIKVHVRSNAHALITTAGATRFYKTEAQAALQHSSASLDDGARLEWLPLENIAYSGCQAQNKLELRLAPTAQLMGWDITALGLPASSLAFDRGALTQHLELCSANSGPSLWLERGRIAGDDQRLLHSPIGLAGHTCLASLYFIAGQALPSAIKEALLGESRAIALAHSLHPTCGITSPHPQVLMLRALAQHTQEALDLCQRVRGAWRKLAWGLPNILPRIWAM